MQPPHPVIGPYRIIGQIGEGGMGTVYEAVHQTIERRVAIKILKSELATDSEIVARFFNEARAVNRIAHPSLVQISDYGQTPEGTVYLVMEFLEGETLQQRLVRLEKQGQRLRLSALLHTIWQVAQALAAAHDKGVVHRDIKTDNIMLVRDPAVATGERAKIVDFGIAKLLQVSRKLTVLPRTMGSVLYMSPEQCRGIPDIDGRTDVYALGVIFYRGLTGRPPFDGDSLEAIIGQHFFVEPAPLAVQVPQVPQEVTELVHRMLVKDRSHRPPMHEVVNVVGELLSRPHVRLAEPLSAAPPELTAGEPGSPARSSSTISRSMGQSLLRMQSENRTLPVALLFAGLGISMAVVVGRAVLRPAPPVHSAQPSMIIPVENPPAAAATAGAKRIATPAVLSPAPLGRPGLVGTSPPSPRPATLPSSAARPSPSSVKVEPQRSQAPRAAHDVPRVPSPQSPAAVIGATKSSSSNTTAPANSKKRKPDENEKLDFFKFGR